MLQMFDWNSMQITFLTKIDLWQSNIYVYMHNNILNLCGHLLSNRCWLLLWPVTYMLVGV